MVHSDTAEAPLTASGAEAAAEQGTRADSGTSAPRADRRMVRNAQGNEVPAEESDAERSEAGKTDAQQLEARQIEAQQIGAEPQESPPAQAPGLIQEAQFQLLNDIFASAGTLSLGAALRGVKEGLTQAAALANPADAAGAAKAEEAPAAAAAAEPPPEAESARAATAPAVVLTLPPEAVKLLAEMKHNRALDFAYQEADRGQVLGTGAQHGITLRPEPSRATGAAVG